MRFGSGPVVIEVRGRGEGLFFCFNSCVHFLSCLSRTFFFLFLSLFGFRLVPISVLFSVISRHDDRKKDGRQKRRRGGKGRAVGRASAGSEERRESSQRKRRGPGEKPSESLTTHPPPLTGGMTSADCRRRRRRSVRVSSSLPRQHGLLPRRDGRERLGG